MAEQEYKPGLASVKTHASSNICAKLSARGNLCQEGRNLEM